jgi:hypothetical protein
LSFDSPTAQTNKKRLSDSRKGVSNTIIHTVATSYPREMLSTLAFQAGNLALPMENHRALQLRDSAGL